MGGIVKGLGGEGLCSAEYYMKEAVLTVLDKENGSSFFWIPL